MKKTILTYGFISGALIAVMMSLSMAFHRQLGFDKGLIFGYTTILLSMSLIFFGIKSYRDRVANGSVTFGRAFLIGLLIAAVSSACYVTVWLIIYYNWMPDYLQQYGDYVVDKMKAAGETTDAINKKVEEMKKFEEMYQNPLVNAAMTFTEPFPVGIVIALISALILKRKNQTKSETITT